MKLESSLQIFEGKKRSNIKFYQNPSNGSRVLCGQTDIHVLRLFIAVLFSHGVVVSAVTGTQVLGLPLFEFNSGFVVVCLSGYICSSASISVMSGWPCWSNTESCWTRLSDTMLRNTAASISCRYCCAVGLAVLKETTYIISRCCKLINFTALRSYTTLTSPLEVRASCQFSPA